MPLADKEARNKYIREYKKRKRQERGPIVRPQRTQEQIQESKVKREAYEKQYLEEHPYKSHCPRKRLLWAASRRSKVRGIPFNLTIDDIVIPERCPYLNVVLTLHYHKGESRWNNISLDRIDPDLGYIKGNVEVISYMANTMKHSATKEMLVLFARKVLERWQ